MNKLNMLPAVPTKWVRSSDGLIAGVCSGIAKTYHMDVWLVRLLWIVAVMTFGTGLLVYAVLALSLPREDKVAEAQQKRFLGVCLRISRQTQMEVGLVRAIALGLALASLGATLIVYVVHRDERR